MNVVIRLPWKRPNEESKWTPEKDNILWTFLVMYRSTEMNWDVISNRLGMPPDECIKRAGYLYQQQLHTIQQKRLSSSSSSLARQPSQESLRESPTGRPSPLSQSPSQREHTHLSQPTHHLSSSPSLSAASSYNDKVDPEYLRECVRRHDFDWLSVGHELSINPMQCRKMYMGLASIATSVPSPNTSSQMFHRAQLPPFDVVMNNLQQHNVQQQQRALPQLQQPPTFSDFSLPAFLPDETKPVNSAASSINSNSSGSVSSMKLGSDMSDDFNANSSSGELFSDTSLTHSALESACFSDTKALE